LNLRKKTENRKIYPPHPSNTVKPFQKKKTTQHFSVLFLCVLIRTPFEEKKRRPKTRPAESGDYKVKKDFFQIKRENFIMAAALLLASCVSSLLKHIFLSKSTNAPYNVYTCKVHFSICLACLFFLIPGPQRPVVGPAPSMGFTASRRHRPMCSVEKEEEEEKGEDLE
jgi:hypothetical protein